MSSQRGDVAYVEPCDGRPMLVAVLAEGEESAADTRWLPQLMAALTGGPMKPVKQRRHGEKTVKRRGRDSNPRQKLPPVTP